jgi:hypothetical protein
MFRYFSESSIWICNVKFILFTLKPACHAVSYNYTDKYLYDYYVTGNMSAFAAKNTTTIHTDIVWYI